MLRTISTITSVSKAITNMLREWDPQINVVYDPFLTYDSAITGIRNYNTALKLETTQEFPLLAWNRSTLQPANELGLRALEMKFTTTSANDAKEYISTLGQYELMFIYIHPNMAEIEKFEILYNSQFGIQEKVVQVDMGSELGIFNYWVTWHLLNQRFQGSLIQDGYYTMVPGACVVRGPFFALNTTLPIITTYNTEVAPSVRIDDYQWEDMHPIDFNTQNSTINTFKDWAQGLPIEFLKNRPTQTLPSPLAEDTVYYVIRDSASRIRLATSLRDAEAKVNTVSITSQGAVATGESFIMRVVL
jgi:hypothetical protein